MIHLDQGLSSFMTECWAPREHFPRFVRICGFMMNHDEHDESQGWSSSKTSCLTSPSCLLALWKSLSNFRTSNIMSEHRGSHSVTLPICRSSSKLYLAFWERLLSLANRHRPAVPMAFSASSVDFTVSLLDDKETCQELRIQCGDSGSQLHQ